MPRAPQPATTVAAWMSYYYAPGQLTAAADGAPWPRQPDFQACSELPRLKPVWAPCRLYLAHAFHWPNPTDLPTYSPGHALLT